MKRNGEMLNKEPRIKLSTIHSAKGGEEDNVYYLLILHTIQKNHMTKIKMMKQDYFM